MFKGSGFRGLRLGLLNCSTSPSPCVDPGLKWVEGDAENALDCA